MMLTRTFPVIGMKCSGCAAMVTKALAELDGVEKADVSLESGLVTVQYVGKAELLLRIRAKINSVGYGIDDLKMYPNPQGQCRLPPVEG